IHELPIPIDDIGDTARHTCREVAPRLAENNHAPPRHILTAVVAHTFYDDVRTTITHRESLTSKAANIGFSARRTVECRISNDDIILSYECSFRGRIDGNFPSGQAFTYIVI